MDDSQLVTFAIEASLFSSLYGRRSRGLMEAELVIVYLNVPSDWEGTAVLGTRSASLLMLLSHSFPLL